MFIHRKLHFSTRVVLFFFIGVLLLTPGFYKNQWNAAGKKWFYDWQRSRDFWVVGRIVWSQQEGIFSNGALLGIGDGVWPPSADVIERQYDVYLYNGRFTNFWPYTSAIGFQGVAYSVFDQVFNLDPAYSLKIFRGITALLTAVTLSGLITWFFLEFGVIAAILALIFVMFSEWIALFSGSIYWQLWAFYLPLIGVTYCICRNNERVSKFLYLIVFIGVVIKGLFTGFEFITTVLVLIFVPVVYYAVQKQWNSYSFLRYSFSMACAAIAGVFTNLIILFTQIASAKRDWKEASSIILYAFEKRTFYDAQKPVDNLNGQSVNVWNVIWKYMDGRAINVGNIVKMNTDWLAKFSEIKYLYIFILFFCVSILFLILYRNQVFSQKMQKGFALMVATWFSALAPLSWLVIFKLHSNIHTQLNFIVWQLPFTIYGFAFCGATLQYLFDFIVQSRKARADDIPQS